MFILGSENSPAEAEVKAYRREHPHTRVILLTQKDCGKDCIG
ncbi:MAG: hypothetical protein WAQ47_08340 [Methanosarcina flavescens]